MRWFMVLCFALACVGASAQEVTDTTMRAAYCAGALKHAVAQMRRAAAEAPTSEIREVAILFQKEMEDRHKRYVDYLLLRIGDMPASSQASKTATLLLLKGKRDAAEKASAPDHPGISRCLASPPQSSISSMVECVAEYDQVYANILRCQKMPDGLPF
jgi:hypothetical protein